MNIASFIKQYTLALTAAMTILSFCTFKAFGSNGQLKRMTVAVYFYGDVMVPSQVENGMYWNTAPNGQSCNFVNHRACMQLVEHTDLTPQNTLDTSKITLGSMYTGVGYIPTRIGGSSSTLFTPVNRY